MTDSPTQLSLLKEEPFKEQTNDTLRNDMWRACDILRRDNNVGGIIDVPPFW